VHSWVSLPDRSIRSKAALRAAGDDLHLSDGHYVGEGNGRQRIDVVVVENRAFVRCRFKPNVTDRVIRRELQAVDAWGKHDRGVGLFADETEMKNSYS
jgi:hypothetical protein